MAIFIGTLLIFFFFILIIKNELKRPKRDYKALFDEEDYPLERKTKPSKEDALQEQLNQYSNYISEYLEDAVKAQDFPETLHPNFADVVAAFSSADTHQISDISYQIIRASDDSLVALSKHADAFRGLVANLPYAKHQSAHYRKVANSAANLLMEISAGHCRCRTYNDLNDFDPQQAESRGEIDISQTRQDTESFMTIYAYHCKRCGASAEAHVNTTGRSRFTQIRNFRAEKLEET